MAELKPHVRVLLVEDDAMVAMMVERAMVDLVGATFSVVHDGGAALELLKQQSFDVVITDLRMAGVDGVQVARAARTMGLPVLVMSGFADAEATDAIEASGAKLLRKPFGIDGLLRALTEVME